MGISDLEKIRILALQEKGAVEGDEDEPDKQGASEDGDKGPAVVT